MSYSVSRLTLYAVISALEEDLRKLIVTHLEGQASTESIIGGDLISRATVRLNKDLDMATNQASLDQLLNYVDFGDLYGILNSNKNLLPKNITRYLKAVTPSLEKIVPIRNRVAHSRPLSFDDLAIGLDIVRELADKGEIGWNNLKEVLIHLEQEPSFVLGLSLPRYNEDIDKIQHNLPIPDFDETGFLGRKQQVTDLLKQCLGPYPVITIVGEGGVGKTALALKIAYDILDLDNCPFEAIVWTSSKTAQLTPREIIRIEGAINDSIGVFKHVSQQLAGGMADNHLEEILSYLKEFKILLILDNLETVLDERIRFFLEQLPIGSKVLITSRIGLGAFEVPFKLRPMEQEEAVQLLRAVATIRGVTELIKIPNKNLATYCNRMKNNPGFIKWFVSAVQTGSRPEAVLERSEVFLDFCMSNVYGYLSKEARRIIRSMLCLPGQYSQAELAFLNEMEAIDLQRAVHELLRTNMVSMSSIPRDSSFESQYDLSELARKYLSKHHPADTKEHEKIQKKKRQLVAAGEQIQADQKSNPYSWYSLTMRSKSDLIVGKYLLDSLKKAKVGDFSEAEILINRARNLAPEYFEVHRVEAIVKYMQDNYSAAQTAYEVAIELEPQSAPLRRWYGSFLMRSMNDVEAGLIQFLEAARLDPNAVEVQIELALANLYLLRFSEVKRILDNLLSNPSLAYWNLSKIYDINLQYYYRSADYASSQRDYATALSNLQQLRNAHNSYSPNIIDTKMSKTLRKAARLANTISTIAHNDKTRLEAGELAEWLNNKADSPFTRAENISAELPFSVGDMLQGQIKVIHQDRKFGFIISSAGDFYFHITGLERTEDWSILRQGDRVSFIVSKDGQDRFKAIKLKME